MTFEIVKKIEVPNSEIIENIEDPMQGYICTKLQEEIADMLAYREEGLSKEEAKKVVENVFYNMTIDEISNLFHELLETILKHC